MSTTEPGFDPDPEPEPDSSAIVVDAPAAARGKRSSQRQIPAPHWYAPRAGSQLSEQLRKVLGPAGDLTESEYVLGGTQVLVHGLAGLFGALVAGRDFLFTHGLMRPYKAALPVISVGNLTTGGAGKTPCVAMLAAELREAGHRPAIVARGYGARKPGLPNDEMMELDLILNRQPAKPAPAHEAGVGAPAPSAPFWRIPMIASPHRRYGAMLALQMGADVVILDDGLQHRQIARDLDIVVMDARDPLGPGSNSASGGPLEGGDYLPRGHMREGLWALERADVIVVARTSLATPLWLQRLVEELHARVPDVPICLADHRPAVLIPHPALAGKRRHAPSTLLDRRIGAFCGIANPEAFGKTLRGLGALMRFSQSFPDHHLYTARELDELAQYARRRNCEVLVTTVKDLTKIPTWRAEDVPLYALQIRMDIQAGRDELAAAVAGAITNKR